MYQHTPPTPSPLELHRRPDDYLFTRHSFAELTKLDLLFNARAEGAVSEQRIPAPYTTTAVTESEQIAVGLAPRGHKHSARS